MTASLLQLSDRIRDELLELEQVLRRIEEGWNYATISTDDQSN